jgi:hypothetical protein
VSMFTQYKVIIKTVILSYLKKKKKFEKIKNSRIGFCYYVFGSQCFAR